MSEEKKKEKTVKLEDVAEETGELIGKGIKKTWRVMKSFGKGVADTLEDKGTQKEVSPKTCPYCSALVAQNSDFCSACGKKL